MHLISGTCSRHVYPIYTAAFPTRSLAQHVSHILTQPLVSQTVNSNHIPIAGIGSQPLSGKLASFLSAMLNFPRSVNITDPSTTADYFAAQWVNPGDIFSVLLILGPEIVEQAVAQLAGRSINPVAFSFGWVSYSA